MGGVVLLPASWRLALFYFLVVGTHGLTFYVTTTIHPLPWFTSFLPVATTDCERTVALLLPGQRNISKV